MLETDKHTKAFNKFYKCRNISEVAEYIGVTRQSVDKWRVAFSWADRCTLRDKQVAEKLETRVINGIVDKKAKMLKELDNLDILIDQVVATAFIKDADGNYVPKIDIERPADFASIVKTKIAINDNRIKILGEDIQTIEVKGDIRHNVPLEETLKTYGKIFNAEGDKGEDV